MGGIKLSAQDGAKLREHANTLKGRHQQKLCRHCGSQILFEECEGRMIPHDLNGDPHWKSCPYSNFTQKKTSRNMLKKFAIYFSLKHSDLDVEAEVGLTEKEGKVYHAILERAINEVETDEDGKSDESQQAEFDESKADLPFKPVPTDPIGDPDEERAPNEELVKALEGGDVLEKSIGMMVKDSVPEVEVTAEVPSKDSPEQE